MFKRRDDANPSNLFDAPSDLNPYASAGESVTVINPASSPAPQASINAPQSSINAPSSPAPQSVSRPAPAPQPASVFRPSAAPIGDMARNRMPEPKTSMSSATASVSAEPKNAKSARRVLTVGNDILLKGEIATCDRLVIEGKVDATLNDVHTVEITESGSFKGSAQIEDAEISGLFEGDLIVRNRLVIYATGRVRGKITYGEIEIERGGEMTGEIKTVNSATAAGTSPRARASSKEEKVAA